MQKTSLRGATSLVGALVLSALATSCGGSHEGHDHGHSHSHAAPHGGLIAELGDHEAHVELLLDAEAGTLTLYALGPHAEQAVRLPDAGIDVDVELGGETVRLTLLPVERKLTGETVGDTSEFAVTDPRLVGLETLAPTIPSVTIRGGEYTDVSFPAAE